MLRLLSLLIAIAVLNGCGSNQKGDKAKAGAALSSLSGLEIGTKHGGQAGFVGGEVVRDRLVNASNGLEVRRWTVLDQPDRVMNVLSQHADGAACGLTAIDRLRRNGLRFIRVKADDIDAIVSELGGATLDRHEWHGQVYDWRSLREQPIDSRGTAVAIDGRVRRFDDGEFRLLIRSWTVLMEDGPHMQLEVLPQHHLPQSNSLRLLIGEEPNDAGEPFASLALDLQLQAGFAYVLVSESPAIDWPQLDKPALTADTNDEAAKAAESGAPKAPATAPVRTRPRGPIEGVGPEAGVPRTLGEALLPASASPPTRELLVFVPKIPRELFPPVYESDFSAKRPMSDNLPGDRSHAKQ